MNNIPSSYVTRTVHRRTRDPRQEQGILANYSMLSEHGGIAVAGAPRRKVDPIHSVGYSALERSLLKQN